MEKKQCFLLTAGVMLVMLGWTEGSLSKNTFGRTTTGSTMRADTRLERSAASSEAGTMIHEDDSTSNARSAELPKEGFFGELQEELRRLREEMDQETDESIKQLHHEMLRLREQQKRIQKRKKAIRPLQKGLATPASPANHIVVDNIKPMSSQEHKLKQKQREESSKEKQQSLGEPLEEKQQQPKELERSTRAQLLQQNQRRQQHQSIMDNNDALEVKEISMHKVAKQENRTSTMSVIPTPTKQEAVIVNTVAPKDLDAIGDTITPKEKEVIINGSLPKNMKTAIDAATRKEKETMVDDANLSIEKKTVEHVFISKEKERDVTASKGEDTVIKSFASTREEENVIDSAVLKEKDVVMDAPSMKVEGDMADVDISKESVTSSPSLQNASVAAKAMTDTRAPLNDHELPPVMMPQAVQLPEVSAMADVPVEKTTMTTMRPKEEAYSVEQNKSDDELVILKPMDPQQQRHHYYHQHQHQHPALVRKPHKNQNVPNMRGVPAFSGGGTLPGTASKSKNYAQVDKQQQQHSDADTMKVSKLLQVDLELFQQSLKKNELVRTCVTGVVLVLLCILTSLALRVVEQSLGVP